MTMVATRTRRTAPATQTAETPDRAIAAALRDVAFVLQMTRKVKDAIVDEKRATATVRA
jgi:hypothetical protein